jgi:uncharacterized membrane protein
MIGVLGIPAIYLLGKELKNEKIGLLAASLTAINYFHIYYSQEVRFYTLLFFASTLSYLFYIKCIKEPKVFNYVAYILFTTLCIYTHYFGLVVAASQAILFGLVIYLNKPDKKYLCSSARGYPSFSPTHKYPASGYRLKDFPDSWWLIFMITQETSFLSLSISC